ncbi:hypothetical protein [Spongiivirga sp. MCCC 1A20706]|uniref:hypothetical protein n=1 Tax=Spongiivirga sp. MCCC 1A20706 TaxID=3160963 RepID=UPI003977C71D
MYCLITITLFGCSTQDENQLDETLEAHKGFIDPSNLPPPVSCSQKFLTPGLVIENFCIVQGQSYDTYSVYVSSGTHTVSYDRNVEVYAAKRISGTWYLIDAAIVTIPANQNVSNNTLIFENADRNYGKIELVISQVTRSSGVIETCYLPRKVSPTIRNCYIAAITGFDDVGPDRDIWGGDSDFDNDGIDNKFDWDDDNDGVGDSTDTDDDNDGNPDNTDTDDDNDGVPDNEDPDN